MTFAEVFRQPSRVRSRTMQDFAQRLQPQSDAELNRLAQESRRVTRRFFGKTMRLFAPLYLSNECINNCQYCGFSRDNPIMRVTLTPDEVEREARFLADQGFRNLLLVSGEHPKFVSNGYLEAVIGRLARFIPSVSLEIAPLEAEAYRPLIAARFRLAIGVPRTRVRGRVPKNRGRSVIRSCGVAPGGDRLGRTR
jgi:2-iminoacetate synthase